MTHEEWVKLTPEQQRIKVAELCGWSDCYIESSDQWVWGQSPSGDWHVVPDYLQDLNAMHEAEANIGTNPNDEKWDRYTDNLFILTMPNEHLYRATAAQRAEAFVLTMTEEK